jgi:hypothetical protein
VTAHVHLVAGAPTALSPAAVRMVAPALQRMGAASVPLASEDPYAREVSLNPPPPPPRPATPHTRPYPQPFPFGTSAGLREAGLWMSVPLSFLSLVPSTELAAVPKFRAQPSFLVETAPIFKKDGLPSLVAHTCYPSYLRGGGRRIMV